MKIKRLLLGASLVFLLTSCTLKLPSWPWQKSSNSGDSSQNSSNNSSGGSSISYPDLPDYVNAYYSAISDSASGDSLKSALNSLNNSKRKRTIGYGSHREYFQYTERASDTPSGKMIGFYNNDLVKSTWDNQATWNHEHIWPNSRGAGSNGSLSSPYIDADIHMVRPAAQSVNSSRGNKMYGTTSSTYDPGQYVEEYRGIAARIIFYCAIADTRLSLTENTGESSSKSSMGKLSDLLQWNLEYLPSRDSSASLALRVEQNRNEVIYSRSELQGNRNPFIDHPEYACKIWGNTNDTTRSICWMN